MGPEASTDEQSSKPMWLKVLTTSNPPETNVERLEVCIGVLEGIEEVDLRVGVAPLIKNFERVSFHFFFIFFLGKRNRIEIFILPLDSFFFFSF